MNDKQTVAIIGASGFIGRALMERLIEQQYRVVAFSRRPSAQQAVDGVTWRKLGDWQWQEVDVLINLAGERIDQRWTEQKKVEFESSRVTLTQQLAESLRSPSSAVRLWINASAVGYYGDRGDDVLPETAAPGAGYLADLCKRWEQATISDALACRVVQGRIGMVLGSGGAAWEQLRRVFSWGLGARLGSGKQWMPWIHIDDITGALLWIMQHNEIAGAVNLVAPQPQRNGDFTRMLAQQVQRPAPWLAPGWVLRILFGGFGAFLLGSTRVEPQQLTRSGYLFRYPTLSAALAALVPPPKA